VLGFRVQGFGWNMLIFILILVKSFNLNISTKSQQDHPHFTMAMYQRKFPKDHIQVFLIQEVTNKTKLESKPTKQQYK
jgi:hypothetical protein